MWGGGVNPEQVLLGREHGIFSRSNMSVSQCLVKTLLSEQKQNHVVSTVNNDDDGEMIVNNNSSFYVFHDS